MLHPLTFWFGYALISVDASDAAAITNILGREGKIYRNFTFKGDRAYFECSAFSLRSVLRLLRSRGIDFTVEKRSGVPALLWRYRKRYGAFVGALIFCAIILFSNLIIWDIRVIGNVTLDEETVEEELAACGFDVGTLISSVNTPVLENIVLLQSDTIAWISINIRGCVAEVEIREAVPEPVENEYFSADLMAERDGVIEWFENTRGNALVNIGDSVKAGDVLVSGYYPEDENVGERYTVAKGEVYARTQRDFEVSVPLEYEKKQYTGRKKYEKYFILFKKEVKFFGNSGNLYANCDTIDTVEYFELPNGVLLPFGVRTVEYAEYETVTAKRSEDSAVELALYELRCLMADGVTEGMLTKKQISAELTDKEYLLHCKAEYIENIAEVRERAEK